MSDADRFEQNALRQDADIDHGSAQEFAENDTPIYAAVFGPGKPIPEKTKQYIREITSEFAVCEWFLWCTGSVVALVEHPVLGLVPVCESCWGFATDK